MYCAMYFQLAVVSPLAFFNIKTGKQPFEFRTDAQNAIK